MGRIARGAGAVGLAAALVAAAAPGRAQEDDGTAARVEGAIARGYGSDCTLAADKATGRDGYYRCVDIGPYRFVREYGATVGYVVLSGNRPFRVMEIKEGRLAFTVQGPWTADLPQRVSEWWSDEVEGGRERRRESEESSGRQRAAEDAVRGYAGDGAAPPAPLAAAPTDGQSRDYAPPPQGQRPYVPTPEAGFAPASPPPYRQEDPGAPLDDGPVPPGAARLAPGVVRR